MRVAARDERRVGGAREAGGVGSEPRAEHGDVEEEDREERAVAVAQVDRDDVGDAGHLGVDVAPDGGDRSVNGQVVEDGPRADVPGVEDSIGPLRGDEITGPAGSGLPGVGDH